MTRRHRALWLGPPGPLLAGTALLLAGVLAGCYGARPTVTPPAARPHASASPNVSASPGESASPDQSVSASEAPPPAATGGPGSQAPHGNELLGKTWIAEGPRGWEAGQIGGRRVALPEGEVGLAAAGTWIVSAILRPTDSIKLLVRKGPAADARTIKLGSLAPTATVIVDDRAYVSGFSFADTSDPGILAIDLETAAAGVLLRPSGQAGTRYLAVSPDGSTLATSLCDLASDPEPGACALTVVALADGTARDVGAVPGGLLRATSTGVAVVAPHGPEAPGWLAGIDLQTGDELWRTAGGEFGPFLMTAEHGLIQSQVVGGAKPRLVIEAIDMRSGDAAVLYEETGSELRSLWPALSSGRHLAVGDDATGSRALAAGGDARTRVSVVPIDGDEPAFDVQVSLRSDQ